MKSPVNLSLFLINFHSFLKISWLIIDPFHLNNVINRLTDRLIYEMCYTCLFAIYSTLLLVWFKKNIDLFN